ncbi:MAG: HEAT repeat domain-containing protein [Gemmataceae bacterium]|nr:HEAT repeat domain-containing protein [Gemmataceae bacterium]MDW8266788.1 HEAT repeat domain-containing protein [Gemmataceae bacterium]
MRQATWNHGRTMAAVVIWVWAATSVAAQTADPIEDLRLALRVVVRDSSNKAELAFRRQNLERHVQALRTISELRRAFSLQEWRDEDRDPLVAAIDLDIRQAVAHRLTEALRQQLRQGTPASQMAAIGMIAEMGVQVRGIGTGVEKSGGFARTFTSDLAELTSQGSETVRIAAMQALGKINPDPVVATRAIARRFDAVSVAERRAAAESLADMVRWVTHLAKGRSTTGVQADRADVVQVGVVVVPTARKGIDDNDGVVRRHCVEAIQLTAAAMSEQIADPRPRQDFPPDGRPLTADERLEIMRYRESVEEEHKEFLPLSQALSQALPDIARRLSDPQTTIRLLASRALEDMGNAANRLRKRQQSIPRYSESQTEHGQGEVRSAQALKLPDAAVAAEPLRPALGRAIPALAQAVADPDARVRLAAIDALETSAEQAAAAASMLVRALEDRNAFVRWAAARTLGKIGPVDPQAVPALARLLNDRDLDVRMLGAAAALERYGPAAAAAVPALAASVGQGDAEFRIAAMDALVHIGPAAAPAVPAIAAALSHRDVRVRRAAAEALSKLGPTAQAATNALLQALSDTDADVRRAASDALLNLVPLPPRP